MAQLSEPERQRHSSNAYRRLEKMIRDGQADEARAVAVAAKLGTVDAMVHVPDDKLANNILLRADTSDSLPQVNEALDALGIPVPPASEPTA